MAKKPTSQKRALREQQERAALGNIFNVFLTGLAAECILILIYRFYINGNVSTFLAWDNVLRVAVWAGLVLFPCGIGLALVKKANKKIHKIGLIAGLSGLYLSAVSLISLRFFETGVVGMCIAIPVITVLGLVFFLYQHECFASTTVLAGALFTIWICGKALGGYWNTLVTICTCAVLVGLVVLMLLVKMLKKNEGKFQDIRIFSPDCDYRLPYLVCAVSFIAVLLVLLLPGLAFYLTWVLVIALFAELAYYTTKMM